MDILLYKASAYHFHNESLFMEDYDIGSYLELTASFSKVTIALGFIILSGFASLFMAGKSKKMKRRYNPAYKTGDGHNKVPGCH